MRDPNRFAYNLGYLFGKVLVTCIFLCLSAIVVALTAKFIGWLFF